MRAVLKRHDSRPSGVEIVCLEGVKRLDVVLRSLASDPEWQNLLSVTILVDADNQPRGRWEEVWDTLGRIIKLPDQIVAQGKRVGTVEDGTIRYGVFLAPSQDRPGRIEDLVLETIDPDIRTCISRLWDCAHAHARASHPSAKAEVAILIALRDDQGLGLGTAFERGLIDVGHAAFEPLRQFVDAQLAP